MKKLLFLLLCTVSMYGQTLQNPTYGTVKLKQNTTDLAAEKVSVQSVDGSLNTIAKTDLINVIERDSYSLLPSPGAINVLYVAKDTNKLYRWNGSTYVDVAPSEITPDATTTVKGKIKLAGDLGGTADLPTVPKLNAGGLLKYDSTNKTIWNNGKGDITTNTIFGDGSFSKNTTGSLTTSIGRSALSQNTTGDRNNAYGYQSLLFNTVGNNNNAFGISSLGLNNDGSFNIAFGNYSLNEKTSGSSNVAVGHFSGRYFATGGSLTNSNNSVFIGTDTRALVNNSDNEIVIGYNAIGSGSNTATFGNTSITKTVLRGEVNGGSFVKSGATTTNLLLAGGGDVSQSSFLKTTGDQFGINGRKSFNEQITFGKVVVTTTGTDTGIQINPSNTSTGLLINNSGTGYGYKGNSLTGDNMLLESSINGKSNYIANINSGGTGFNFVGQNDGANTYTVNKTGDVVAKSVTLTGQTKASSVISGEYRYNSDLSVANSRAWKTKNDYPVAGSWALQVASDSNETSFDDVITSDRSGIVSVKSNFNVFNATSSILAVTAFKLKNNDGSSFGDGGSFFQTNNFGYLKLQPNQTNIYGYKSGGVRVVSGLSDINFATGNADLDNSDTRMTIKSTGSVLINTSTDIASSKLTVSSTSQGVLIPRMTTAQKNAIVSPAEGLQVYDLTLHAICFYNGTVWKTVMTL